MLRATMEQEPGDVNNDYVVFQDALDQGTIEIGDQNQEHLESSHQENADDNGQDGSYATLTPVTLTTLGSATVAAQDVLHASLAEVGEFYYNYNATYERNDSPSSIGSPEDNSDETYDPRADGYDPGQGSYGQGLSYHSIGQLGNESSGSSRSGGQDPFSESCRIPLPGLGGDGGYLDSRTFVRRRNERERARVRNVNDGFERLRRHLPNAPEPEPKDRRLSKVETLRYAIGYIRHLQSLLKD